MTQVGTMLRTARGALTFLDVGRKMVRRPFIGLLLLKEENEVMDYPALVKRAGAFLLSASLILVTVPPVGAAGSVVGTIQVSGPAWVASPQSDWSRLSSTRPLVSGDRLRTGADGYLLADLGDSGVVGLYGDAEVSTNDSYNGPVVDVLKGKVAFHLSAGSGMQLQASGAGILPQSGAADGYVEYGHDGIPVVVVEEGALNVQIAGIARTIQRGERVSLSATQAQRAPEIEPVQLAGADDEGDGHRRAAAVAVGGGATYAGLTAAGWTAVALVAGAVTAAAVVNDDNNGSP